MVKPIWRARLFRLWLVIGVPLACWAAYEAWDAHQKVDFWNNQLEQFRVHTEAKDYKGTLDVATALGQQNRSVYRANTFTWIAAALAALPIVGAIILKALEWVWTGPSKMPMDSGARTIVSRSWRDIASSKRARWGISIGGLLALTGVMYSLRPESTTTTLIQVGVQVGVLGAVLALIKFFRR